MTKTNVILAIDTASEYLSLAIKYNDKQDSILLKIGNQQSSFVIPQIQELLNKHNLSVQQISHIAYNQGPGSFTGLRIGISVAMGIAYGLDINLIPIPSFAIYANAIKHKLNNLNTTKIIVGIDARLNQIYMAGINIQNFKYFIEPYLVDPNEIKYIDNAILCGNGFEIYNDKLISDVKNMPYLTSDNAYPNALNLIDLCQYYEHTTPQNAELLYIRNKIALNLEEQHANKQS